MTQKCDLKYTKNLHIPPNTTSTPAQQELTRRCKITALPRVVGEVDGLAEHPRPGGDVKAVLGDGDAGG